MQFFLIVLVSILAAIIYGIAHNQVTARVCLEYFTIGHPPVFDTHSPTLLAFAWVFATWWMGLILGIGLAIAARAGSGPKRSPRSLVSPIVWLMGMTGLCALLAGIAGFALGEVGLIWLVKPVYNQVPRDVHSQFLADLWAHVVSYFVGGVGGLILMIGVWRSRRVKR